MYLWTGAHHLLWTPVPDWIQTLAMAFSIMLIAPSWGSVFNGYLSMNGAVAPDARPITWSSS